MKNLSILSLQTLIVSDIITIRPAGTSELKFKAHFVMKAQNCINGNNSHLHEPQYELDEFEEIELDGEPVPSNPVSMIGLRIGFEKEGIDIGKMMENASDLWAKENINLIEFRHIYRQIQTIVGLDTNLLEVDDQDFDYLASIQK